MRYILHYTKPGDIIFDGFCGSGMTGLASKMCESVEEIEALNYKVDNNVIKNGILKPDVQTVVGTV